MHLPAPHFESTFPRLWAALLLTLIAVTYPLWFPARDADHPLLPLFEIGIASNRVIAWLASITLVIALVAIVFKRSSRCWGLVAISLGVSFVVDQHRLQPWAYQSAIYALIWAALSWAALPPRAARLWIIGVASSIYLYSAAGKFDYQFAHTVGQDFLTTVARPLGGIPAAWDAAVRAKMALIFPAVELMCGIGLLMPRTRRLAGVGVIVMHLSLIMILGPWGLGHSLGVLAWNAALICQAYMLFVVDATRETTDRRSVAAPVVYALLIAVLLLPLGERAGYWDHWTSWALYAPHSSRVDVEVHASAIEGLPPTLQPFVSVDRDGDRWHALDLAGWSLAVRKVPLYPQARYQLAMFHWLVDRDPRSAAHRARWRGVADRWTGQRVEKYLTVESHH